MVRIALNIQLSFVLKFKLILIGGDLNSWVIQQYMSKQYVEVLIYFDCSKT